MCRCWREWVLHEWTIFRSSNHKSVWLFPNCLHEFQQKLRATFVKVSQRFFLVFLRGSFFPRSCSQRSHRNSLSCSQLCSEDAWHVSWRLGMFPLPKCCILCHLSPWTDKGCLHRNQDSHECFYGVLVPGLMQKEWRSLDEWDSSKQVFQLGTWWTLSDWFAKRHLGVFFAQSNYSQYTSGWDQKTSVLGSQWQDLWGFPIEYRCHVWP